MEIFRSKPTMTKDGREVELVCNIGRPNDTANIVENDGEGIGLLEVNLYLLIVIKRPMKMSNVKLIPRY